MPRGKTTTQKCIKCGKEISLFAYNRHIKTCKNEIKVVKKRVAWNKGLSKETNNIVKQYCDSNKGKHFNPHSEETKKKLSNIAKERNFGGYRQNAGRSKKFAVLDSFGNKVTLQSSYEFLCFKILTKYKIKWIRPKALKYDNKNYFADFYLPDYLVWLDPKNDYKAKIDEEKIKKVITQNNIKLFVILKHQLTENYILWLLSSVVEQTTDNR